MGYEKSPKIVTYIHPGSPRGNCVHALESCPAREGEGWRRLASPLTLFFVLFRQLDLLVTPYLVRASYALSVGR